MLAETCIRWNVRFVQALVDNIYPRLPIFHGVSWRIIILFSTANPFWGWISSNFKILSNEKNNLKYKLWKYFISRIFYLCWFNDFITNHFIFVIIAGKVTLSPGCGLTIFLRNSRTDSSQDYQSQSFGQHCNEIDSLLWKLDVGKVAFIWFYYVTFQMM